MVSLSSIANASEIANSPISAGISGTPSYSSSSPKVARGVPNTGSTPMVPIIRPKNPAMMPLSMSCAAMAAISVRPNTITTTISTLRKYSPILARNGNVAMVSAVVISPPNADAEKHSTSACCAWPFFVIG